MKLTIEISLDNAAFEDNQNELQQILQELALDILMMPTDSEYGTTIRDSNGNPVGFARIVTE